MGKAAIDPSERFWSKVDVPIWQNHCWTWLGAVGTHGYGVMHFGARNGIVLAHRFAYEVVNGPVPAGLQLDHLCRNRTCCNPAHLEAVTQAENIRRGDAESAKCNRENRCKHGHEFTPDNIYRSTDGKRKRCRTCACRVAREKYQARKAVANV